MMASIPQIPSPQAAIRNDTTAARIGATTALRKVDMRISRVDGGRLGGRLAEVFEEGCRKAWDFLADAIAPAAPASADRRISRLRAANRSAEAREETGDRDHRV